MQEFPYLHTRGVQEFPYLHTRGVQEFPYLHTWGVQGMEIPTYLRCPRWSVDQESLQLADMFQPLFHAGYSYSTLTLGGQNLEENF